MEKLVAPVQHRPGHRLTTIEGLTHAGPPAVLAGVREANPGRLVRCCLIRRLDGVDQRTQSLPQLPSVAEDKTGAAREVAPAHAGGPGQVGQHRVGCGAIFIAEPREIAFRQLPEGACRLAERGNKRVARSSGVSADMERPSAGPGSDTGTGLGPPDGRCTPLPPRRARPAGRSPLLGHGRLLPRAKGADGGQGPAPGTAGQSVFSDATRTGIRSHSTLGFGVRNAGSPVSLPCSSPGPP